MDPSQLDLVPPYPTPATLRRPLESTLLTTEQRKLLAQHSLVRAACLFADLPLLSYLLQNHRDLVDIDAQDDDGLCLISQSILGFGEESERNMDREECIRLLISHGARVDDPDHVGWTPLHHAALRAPATLVVHLLMHGASPLATSRKLLTPLDIIMAYQPIPDRQDVALVLQEAMREKGWEGSPLEIRRQSQQRKDEARKASTDKRVGEWNRIGRALGMGEAWWGTPHGELASDDPEDFKDPVSDDDLGDEMVPEEVYSPAQDYMNMLVFSLETLPSILQAVIVDADPVIHPVSQRSAPANAVYLLARFACLQCDESWFDHLLTSCVDRIEEVVYARPDRQEDMAHLAFWLYNSTLLLHLLKCDRNLYDMCESLDLFSLIEELVNAIYVFILRGAEKRIDPLIDAALLDYSPLSNEFDSIQFESDWSFFRSLTPKRKLSSISNSHPSSILEPSSPKTLSAPRSTSPIPSPSSSVKAFSSLRQTVSRSSHPPISSVFPPPSPSPGQTNAPVTTPTSITVILSSVHALLTLYSINPAIIIQAHTQIMYWISCEVFNRMLTRKKYLCRSRAMQIGLNVSVLEEWVGSVGLPSGVASHFQSVKELVSWLQCHSSIDQFLALVDTIQTMRALNPLQMRRAVRDYRYEVTEGRMTEECVQYLAQLQKDWERRRVKLGVEALRKEINERNRERADSVTSGMSGHTLYASSPSITPAEDFETLSTESRRTESQLAIDGLFDRNRLKSEWTAPSSPDVLGELLDSTYMLPLALPSDPELLAAWPGPTVEYQLEQEEKERKRHSREASLGQSLEEYARSASRASIGNRGAMGWRLKSQTMRFVQPELVEWVDGGVRVRSEPLHVDDDDDDDDAEEKDRSPELHFEDDGQDGDETVRVQLPPDETFTLPAHLHRRLRHPRESSGGDTVVPSDYRQESTTPEKPRTIFSHDSP